MNLAYFVVLVSALIFVHEFGHFIVAKFFNVKVLTFSIGFGPKIIRIRGKETEYCLALLPFGGFVRMLEESSGGGDILPEERARTFEAQAYWKRVLIVLAGPAMNVLFPVVLYTTVFLEDRTFHAPLVGSIEPGKPADGKLMPGDAVLAIDGTDVTSFPQIQAFVADHPGAPLKFLVDRDGKKTEVWVTPANEIRRIEPAELDLYEHEGKVGISPKFGAAVVGLPRTDAVAHRAGLRTFDRVISINGRKVDRYVDLINLLSQNRGDAVVLTVLRPVPVNQALGGLCDFSLVEPVMIQLTPLPRDADARLDDFAARERDVLARIGAESSEMYVAFVPEGSSEWKAGLRVGDRIQSLDGVQQRRWRTMEASLKSEPTQMHELAWTRAGDIFSGRFQMRTEAWVDDGGKRHERYVFRTMHWLPDAPDALVPNPHPFMYAVKRGVTETANVVRYIVVGFWRMAQGRLSLSSMSGPIRMYELAGEAGARGTTEFLWAMAVISANLGLVNLLPVPVLDGGHLLLFSIEVVLRRRLSLGVRKGVSLFGMAILVILMLVAFKNDMAPRWDDLILAVKELVAS